MFSALRKLARRLFASPRKSRPALSRKLSLDTLEDRLVLSTMVWDGSADGSNVPYANANWSSPQNWVGDVAPNPGDDLQFPATALQLATNNDYPAGTVFNSLSFSGTGYTLSGNALALMAGIKTSNLTGVNTLGMPLTLAADQTITSGVGGTNLLLSGATLDNGGYNLTFGGTGDVLFSGTSITGAGGLTKNGAGQLILEDFAPNTYTGTTTVNRGTLLLWAPAGNAIPGSLVVGSGTSGSNTATVRLTAANQINNTAPITINGTGLFDLNGFSETVGPLTLQAGAITTGTGTLTLNGDVTTLAADASATISGKLALGNTPVRTFTLGYGTIDADLDISATISGSGVQLVKQGYGFLKLDGNNTYSGGNLVSQGTLWITNAHALGATSAGTAVTAGTSLLLDSPNSSITFAAYPLILNGSGDPDLVGSGALQGDANSAVWPGPITLATASTIMESSGTTLNITGLVTGSGNLTKTGSGEVMLSHTNDYTGATVIKAGILTADNFSSLGAIGPTSGTTVNGSGVLQLEGNLTFLPEYLTLQGTGGNGLSTLHSEGTNTWTGPIILAATSQINVSHGDILTICSTIAGPLATSSLIVGRSTSAGDDGTVLLTAANTYAGATSVTVGTLAISNAMALGSSVGVANPGTTVSSGATLQLQGGLTFDPTETLTLNGGGLNGVGALQNGSGTNTWTAPVTLASSASIGGSGTLTVTGAISGASSSAVTKVGGGTVILNAANTYTGSTTVAAGTLGAENAAALGAASKGTTVNSGATLQLMGGNVFNPESLVLNGTGVGGTAGALRNRTGSNTWTGALITLGSASTVEADAGTLLTLAALPGSPTQAVANEGYLLTVNTIGDVTMANNISGAGGLTKLGTGTLTFSGTSPNTYAGATAITAGTLVVAKWAGIAAVSGAGLTISSGAVLAGTGLIFTNVINAGTINLAGVGATGTLTIIGNYTQSSTGILNIELGGTAGGAFDQLAITGKASLNGTLNVSLLTGYVPNVGDGFAVLTFGSSVGAFLAVNGLSLGNGEALGVVSDPADLTLVTVPM